MNRRKLLLSSGITLSTVLAGCSSDDTDDGNGNGSGNGNGGGNGGAIGDEGNGGDEVSEPEPITVSGSGNDVIDDIDIAGGLVTANAEHSGGDNFIVQLVPNQGDYNTLFINTIGSYQGVAAELAAEGTYQLSVEAGGDWEIELQQPRASSGESLPLEWEGSMPNVYGPVEFGGPHTLTATHNGEQNFIVRVMAPEGDFATLAVNEIGQYEGTTSFRHSGVGYIDVQADGDWSLEIE